MYSLGDYGRMIADGPRLRAYSEALTAAIQPDSLVLEIGTGPGFFALMAARLGARKVWAVETDDSIQLARELARANGLADRIEFLRLTSQALELEEKVDVLFSDLRGTLPFLQQHLPSVIDARTRLLKPNGTLIPGQDTLWASLIRADELYDRHYSVWQRQDLDLDLSRAAEMVGHSWIRADLRKAVPLSDARRWATLDYRSLQGPDCHGQVSWNIPAAGLAHGTAVWFDSQLLPGIGYSNAPGEPLLVYRQAFFPFPHPVHLEAGDRVDMAFEAKLVIEDYIWQWTTRVERGREVAERFRQSTFMAKPLSPDSLHKSATSHCPSLNPGGRVLQLILARMDGKQDLESIAKELMREEPDLFPHLPQALGRVAEVSRKYARDRSGS
jgi:protein arginine N-methyltransferase 1